MKIGIFYLYFYNLKFYLIIITLDNKKKLQYNKNMEKLLEVNRVAFSIKGFDVYWYGLIICTAIIVAISTATVFCKIRGYKLDSALNIALVSVPSGILGARLFSVLFESGLSFKDFFNFRTGGMSIIGAVIGGAIGILVYTLVMREKEQPFKYFDIVCSVLLLAQAIGRWGNYFNGEVYGQLIETGSFFARFPFAVEIDGYYYQALFFYECILDLIGFFFTAEIFILVKKKTGYTTGFYLMYYGTVRTILENFRQETYILKIGGARVSLICSILMIVAGLAIFIVSYYLNNKKKASKYGKTQRL